MLTTLLLNDEIIRATLLLQNAGPTETPVRETEAVAGCNCDRWGHPCPRCDEPKAQGRAFDFIPSRTSEVNTSNTRS
jgi:hypothetical protein